MNGSTLKCLEQSACRELHTGGGHSHWQTELNDWTLVMLAYSRYKYGGWKRKREDYERKAGKKNERRIEFVYVVTPFHVQGRNDCNEDASIQTLILHFFDGKWHVQENQHRKQRYIFLQRIWAPTDRPRRISYSFSSSSLSSSSSSSYSSSYNWRTGPAIQLGCLAVLKFIFLYIWFFLFFGILRL